MSKTFKIIGAILLGLFILGSMGSAKDAMMRA